MSDYASLKVPELKKLLAEKKLSQTGNKADLIARLQEADKKDATASTEDGKPGMYIDCAFSFFLFDMVHNWDRLANAFLSRSAYFRWEKRR